MTISRYYSDSIQSGSKTLKTIRFLTMMTDECSRVSGRKAPSPNVAKQYWKFISSRMYNIWSNVNSGINKNTGVVTEYECDARDYPTIDELSMNLSNYSTGVSVLFTGRENGSCANVEDYSEGEFWELVVEAADDVGITFAYKITSGDSDDITEKVIWTGIQSVFSDVCAGN